MGLNRMYKLGNRKRTPLNVDPADKRDPMLRLLQDGLTNSGEVCVNYAQQWPTKAKAMRLGYLDGTGCITEAGRAFVERSKA